MVSRRLRPLPPPTQALSCKTFRPPPLDGSLSVQELYEWHADNNPDHRLFVYSRADGSTHTISWREAARAIYACVKTIRARLGWTPGSMETPVIGILAPSGAHCCSSLSLRC